MSLSAADPVSDPSGRVPSAARCVVPPDWPDLLTCPRCHVARATATYRIMQRPKQHRDQLARVVLCPDPACNTYFAPTAAYLAGAPDASASETGGLPHG